MPPELPDHNDIILGRYAKVAALRAENVAPYPNRWEEPTHTSAQIQAGQQRLIEEKTPLRVAGRIMTIRHMGKASFFHLKDNEGRIQVYVRRDDIPEDQYRVFHEHIDMGDLVGITGFAFVTRTGELSVHAESFHLLTKSVRPLPEKWHGLTDKETRYRQRYVDLIVNDEVRDTFVSRSRIVSSLRSYLTAQGYLEVETPMMHPISGGATARPFITHHNALDMPLYLRIAPELYLKRLMVGGLDKVFEINRNFRNEGLSPRHNPEFTMLELYTAHWDYRDMMQLTEETLRHAALEIFGNSSFTWGEMSFDIAKPFPRLTYLDAIRRYVPGAEGAELSWSDSPDVTARKVRPFHTIGETLRPTHEVLTEIFEDRVESHLVEPVFITDFAKAVSPLSKSKADDPAVAERFELYICGMEIANGYSELNDPSEQYERFCDQAAAKAGGDEEACDMDEDYVRALEYGMPPTAGLGIGIDRTVMVLTNSASIRDVILFPLMRPEVPAAECSPPQVVTE